MVTSLVGLIILVANIIGIIDCVKSNKDSGKKILWVLLILLIPGIGVILYYAVGRK